MNIILWLLAVPTLVFGMSFILVGVGLLFKKDMGKRTFNNGETIDCYELPDWLKWCQNPEDLLMGDHPRGWYWFTYMAGRPDWWKMLVWSGFRNPFNYWKRIATGCDIRTHKIVKLAGVDYVRDDFDSEGFQILKAIPTKGDRVDTSRISKPALYWVRRWGKTNRAIVVQLGWKIKLSHNEAVYDNELDYFKGWTFEIQPFKDIS